MPALPLAADAATLSVFSDSRSEKIEDLPLLQEWAYDFENNELLLKDGVPYLVEGDEALKIWLYWAVTTQKDRWRANSTNYGSEIERMIGLSVSAAIKNSELERTIREAVEESPYVERVDDISLEVDGGLVTVNVSLTSVYSKGVSVNVEV